MHLAFICNVQLIETTLGSGNLSAPLYANTNIFNIPTVSQSASFSGDSPDLPYTVTTSISAGSSGSPTVLTTNINVVTSSTSSNNYIQIANIAVGIPQFITNFSDNVLNVLPPTGESFNELSANTAVQLAANGATIQIVGDTTSRSVVVSVT